MKLQVYQHSLGWWYWQISICRRVVCQSEHGYTHKYDAKQAVCNFVWNCWEHYTDTKGGYKALLDTVEEIQ